MLNFAAKYRIMIAEFKVRNFLSIKEEQVLSFIPTTDNTMLDIYTEEVADNIRLLKIGSIYGSNASGKTNVLLALDFFRNLMICSDKSKSERIGVVPFKLDKESLYKSTFFEMVFYINRDKYKLSVELDDEKIYNEKLLIYTTVRPTIIYDRHYDSAKDATIIDFGNKIGLTKKDREVIEGNTINNRSVIAAFGISNVRKSQLNLVFDMFAKEMTPVIMPGTSLMNFTMQHLLDSKNGKLKKFILNFLKASDFNISNISLRNGELVFSHHTETCGDLNLEDQFESRGTKRYLGLATILFDLLVNGNILPIDEIEASIHYELLSYFIRVFLVNSKKGAQLILTTHDINLLDEDFIRRDSIWFTDKNLKGESELYRLSSLGLHKTMSVYNAYRQNKLVDLPFLDSIYLDMDEYND